MSQHPTVEREAGLAAKFAAVGLIGLAVDATLLHAGLYLGLSSATARLISLLCAMQVTFAINGLGVFHCLTRARAARQWLGYMTTNGFGNVCNFWIFVTLASLHHRWLSNSWLDLAVSSFSAYLINYAGARLLVFGSGRPGRIGGLARRARQSVCGPPTQAPPTAESEAVAAGGAPVAWSSLKRPSARAPARV